MSTGTAVALVLALLSTVITNLASLREHDAAAALPVLSMPPSAVSGKIRSYELDAPPHLHDAVCGAGADSISSRSSEHQLLAA